MDKMREIGSECDFVEDVAIHYPLYVILSLLGLPESDFPRMLKLTQEMFGGDDAEHQRGETPEDLLAVLADFFNYFANLTGVSGASGRPRIWHRRSPTPASTASR